MSDIVLGTIIGGIIALFGTISGYIIQGIFSLKRTNTENTFRTNEQNIQIQFEREKALVSRTVEIREKYLIPLSDKIIALFSSVINFRNELIKLTGKYSENKLGEYYIKVIPENRNEFFKKCEEIRERLDERHELELEIHQLQAKVTDIALSDQLFETFSKTHDFYINFLDFMKDFTGSQEDQPFVYDCSTFKDLSSDCLAHLATINYRIESLLGGMSIIDNDA